MFGFSDLLPAQTSLLPSHRKWEFFTFGGVSSIASKDQKTPVIGEEDNTSRFVGLHYSSGYLVGLRIGENIGDYWGAEFEYSYSNQPLRLTDLSPGIPSLDLSHSVHRLVYDILYYPLPKASRFRPFAFAGGGASLFYIKGSSKTEGAALGLDLKDRWKAAFSWGGGLKFLVRDQFALRFQIGDQATGVPDYGFPSMAVVGQDQFTPGFKPSGYLHNWLLTFGLVYQWGER
jgi:opacity protein-like surface antigen